MFGDKPKDVPQPFALILVPEFTMMPVTSAIEPLRIANRLFVPDFRIANYPVQGWIEK